MKMELIIKWTGNITFCDQDVTRFANIHKNSFKSRQCLSGQKLQDPDCKLGQKLIFNLLTFFSNWYEFQSIVIKWVEIKGDIFLHQFFYTPIFFSFFLHQNFCFFLNHFSHQNFCFFAPIFLHQILKFRKIFFGKKLV